LFQLTVRREPPADSTKYTAVDVRIVSYHHSSQWCLKDSHSFYIYQFVLESTVEYRNDNSHIL